MSQQYYSNQNPMQSPFGGGGENQYGQPNPLIGNAIGLFQNKEIRQMGANYLQEQIKNRLVTTPSLSDYIFTSKIRSYFDIDNKYVLKKLLKIVFPFSKSADSYTTQNSSYDSGNYGMEQTYGGSSEDHHHKRLLSPDLYIPLMAFMTFILMICLERGISSGFKPDLIGYYTTNCLFFAALEMLLYKVILLVVRVKTVSFLDLIAFLNYKFVGLCMILLLSFIFGGWINTIITLYFSISFVYYMYAELRTHAEGVAEGIDIGKTSLKSDTIIYFLSGLQFATMWLLVLTTASSGSSKTAGLPTV